MSVFAIQLESRRKARPRVCVDAPPGSARLPCACLAWGGFLFIWLNYCSASPLVLSADAVQLFNSWPSFTPGGGIWGRWLGYVSTMCCLGFAKSHRDPWKTRVISQDSPKLAGRNKHCVLEKWVLGMKGCREKSWGEKSWEGGGSVHFRKAHSPSWGFAKDAIGVGAIALSLTLLI